MVTGLLGGGKGVGCVKITAQVGAHRSKYGTRAPMLIATVFIGGCIITAIID